MKPSVTRRGVVYLVGAGPGDPGLITVRGRALLDDCDAIVFDALANPALLERARAGGRIELHDAGKRGGSRESAKQDEISALLVALAVDGKRVVRLKGGDPFVFGRGSEEAQALSAAGVRFEVVPGVTAGIAAPAYAGIPVTHRGMATSVTFVTGHEDPSKPATMVDWRALATSAATGTLVLYMGVKTLPAIAQALIDGGLAADTPAAAVQWGTHAKQRTVVATVATLAQCATAEGLTAPVISVIGQSVSLREEIGWFESRPLFGRRIVVTRATGMPGSLAAMLREEGADVIEASSTTIERLDPKPLQAAIGRLSSYQWLILTSPTGVRVFGEGLERAGLDSRALAGLKIAVIGPSTGKTLAELGLRADIMPERFVAESLLESLRADATVRGARVLYAAAEDARAVLADGLRSLGATVDVVATYRSTLVTAGPAVEALRDAVDAGHVDLVTFTSASAVAGFVAQLDADRAKGVKAISIGPVTTEAALDAGLDVVGQAREATLAGVVDAAVDVAGRRRPRSIKSG